jgi:hypothetical protein
MDFSIGVCHYIDGYSGRLHWWLAMRDRINFSSSLNSDNICSIDDGLERCG